MHGRAENLFCSFGYPMRNVELSAMSNGSDNYKSGDWYNFDDTVFKDSFMQFADALGFDENKLTGDEYEDWHLR